MKTNCRIFAVLLIALLPVLLLSSGQSASAQGIQEMQARFVVGENSASAEYLLVLQECPEGIEIAVPGDAYNISASVSGTAVSTTALGEGFEKSIAVPLSGFDDCSSVVLRYESAAAVERGARNFFLVEVSAPLDVKELAIEVKLPVGAALEKPAAEGGSAFPRDYALNTDGQRIALSWERSSLAKGESVAIFVVYTYGFAGFWFWAVTGLAAILVAGAAAGAYLKFARKKRPGRGVEKGETVGGVPPAKKLEALEAVEEHLLEDERRVVKMLKSAGGEVKQKHLLRNLEMSKAKLSRVLRNLEERRVVQKSPEGKTNIVKLLE